MDGRARRARRARAAGVALAGLALAVGRLPWSDVLEIHRHAGGDRPHVHLPGVPSHPVVEPSRVAHEQGRHVHPHDHDDAAHHHEHPHPDPRASRHAPQDDLDAPPRSATRVERAETERARFAESSDPGGTHWHVDDPFLRARLEPSPQVERALTVERLLPGAVRLRGHLAAVESRSRAPPA